jgi:hypothetical protein
MWHTRPFTWRCYGNIRCYCWCRIDTQTSCHWNFPLPFNEFLVSVLSVLNRCMGIARNHLCMRTDLLQYTLVVMLGDYHNLMFYTTGLLPKYAYHYIYHEFSPITNRWISWRDTDQPLPKEYYSDCLCRWCDDSFNWPIGYGQSRWNSSTLDAGYWSIRWHGQIDRLTYRNVTYAEDHNGHTTQARGDELWTALCPLDCKTVSLPWSAVLPKVKFMVRGT